MDFKDNKEFDEIVDKFKVLNIKQKQKITIKEFKEILSLFNNIMKYKNIDKNVLYNKEIYDLENNQDNYSDDDYVEAVYVYINMIKELLATYVDYSEKK